ncbi:MAG: glycosyltransferase family 9 protein [Prosthecobacter sp.]|uniref:glycosyltransferase family 9 protein n=1 Tax=Prosthecobacter sp. TaxID=1965333 RepID=UPI003900FC19
MSTAVVYHKQLGDTLLLQPALARLAAQDHEPVTLYTLPGHRPLVELMPGVQWGERAGYFASAFKRVVALDQGSQSLLKSLRLRARHRLLLTRAEVYIRWYHRLLFHACRSENLNDIYVARFYFDAVGGAASDTFTSPKLHAPPPEWVQPEISATNAVIINPASGWERKSWTVEGWRSVIRSVLAMDLGPVFVSSGTSEWHQRMGREICEGFPASQVRNLAGQTTLRGFLALLARATITLTVDGAASHISQAFGRPTVVLFGPSKTRMWHYETPQNRAIHASEFSTEALPPTALIPPERIIDEMQLVLASPTKQQIRED